MKTTLTEQEMNMLTTIKDKFEALRLNERTRFGKELPKDYDLNFLEFTGDNDPYQRKAKIIRSLIDKGYLIERVQSGVYMGDYSKKKNFGRTRTNHTIYGTTTHIRLLDTTEEA